MISAFENLIGSAFNDNLTGTGSANSIAGGAGNDNLDGGAGADTLLGGLGDDQYFVDNAGDALVEAASEGYDVVRTSISYALTPGAEIEAFTTTNHSGTAAIDLTGNEFGQYILGNDGANTLDGRAAPTGWKAGSATISILSTMPATYWSNWRARATTWCERA